MEQTRLQSILEALILASEEPLALSTMALIMEPDGVVKADIEAAIEAIRKRYNDDPSVGFGFSEVAGGYQIRTKLENAAYVDRLNIPKPSRLSQASLETLAIIAYRQPLVRSEIEEIRGVDCGGVLRTLLERNLIKIIGKRDEAGSPLIYATTEKFLELFSLGSLKELPTLKEYEELEKEHYKTAEMDNRDGQKPILEEIAAAPFVQKWDKEDEAVLSDVAEGIKKLKNLEKNIFPKSVETIVAIPNQDREGGDISGGRTPTEDTGTGNTPF